MCDLIDPTLSKETLYEDFCIRSKELFSQENVDQHTGATMLFPAEHYVCHNIIDASLIRHLQKGATLLSVGCGLASWERILHSAYNVKTITLCDTNNLSLELQTLFRVAQNCGIPYFNFNMFNSWDTLDDYDYIVFPNSINYALHSFNRFGGDPKTNERYQLLKRALSHLHRPGEIRIRAGVLDADQRQELQNMLMHHFKHRLVFPELNSNPNDLFVQLPH